MGYYLTMGRPAGAPPPTLEEIQDALDRRPWIAQDPEDPTAPGGNRSFAGRSYLLEGCWLLRCDEPPDGGHLVAPWLQARLSWGESRSLRQIIVVLLDLADELGMHLFREDRERIRWDDLAGVEAEHARGARVVVGLIGSTRQPAPPDLQPGDRDLLDSLTAKGVGDLPRPSVMWHLQPEQPLAELVLSARTGHVLRLAGLRTLADVAALPEAEFLALPRATEAVRDEIAAHLRAAGLAFLRTRRDQARGGLMSGLCRGCGRTLALERDDVEEIAAALRQQVPEPLEDFHAVFDVCHGFGRWLGTASPRFEKVG